MPANLPQLGEVSYNGFVFPVTRRTEINGQARRDDAGRTVIGMDYRIRVECWITPDDYPSLQTADYAMDSLRQTLTKQGAKLIVSGIGFGDLSVNTGSDVWDMAFGPKPTILNWQTAGGNLSVRLVWECTTFVPECQSTSGLQGLVAFNFKTSFSTDKNWLTTITRDGYYEIAMTRRMGNGRIVFNSAGDYLNLIQAPLIPNFTRERTDYRESLDKRRMDFSIVDAARNPNQLPYGCSEARASHSTSNLNKSICVGIDADIIWAGRITASFTLLTGFSKGVAYDHFLNLVRNICYEFNRPKSGFMPKNININEGLYLDSQKIDFTLDYIFGSSWRNIMATGGFDLVAPNTDGAEWIRQWRIAGYSENSDLYRLRFSPVPDTIVDICQTDDRVLQYVEATQPGQGKLKPPQNLLGTDFLSPDSSWISWRCGIEVKIDYGTVQHTILSPVGETTLKAKPFPASGSGNPATAGGSGSTSASGGNNAVRVSGAGGTAGAIVGGVASQMYTPPANPPVQTNSAVQTAVPARVRIILWGDALRCFYTIPIPELISVAGKPCVPIEAGHANQWMIESWCGVPIWAASWSKEYVCEGLDAASIQVPKPTKAGLSAPNIVFK